MKISQVIFHTCFWATSLFFSAPALAGQEWGWFRASSNISSWSLSEGKADVSINPSSFSAQLYTDSSRLAISLEGTISDRTVTAEVVYHGTDNSVAPLPGLLRRTCWEEGGGREVIVLTNGWEVVSLVHEIPDGQPCSPLN